MAILPINDVVNITDTEPRPTNKPYHATDVAESAVDETILLAQYQECACICKS